MIGKSTLAILWAFFVRDAKIAFSYRLQFFFTAAGAFSVSVSFFFLALMMKRVEGGITSLAKYGGSYFAFALVGIAFSTFLDASLRTFGAAIRQAQMTGTLEAMLTTRARIGSLIAGTSAYTLVFTMFRSTLFVFIGVLVFQMRIHLENWWCSALILLFTMSATMALGIFSAGFVVLFKQGDPITAAVSGLSWLLSGILYPREILPFWVQRAADLLPMTHMLQAMRLSLLTGAPLGELLGSLGYLVGFSLLGIPLSITWFGWAVGRARIDGSLARY